MKRIKRIIIPSVIIIPVLLIVPSLFKDSEALGRFRTPEGEMEYKTAYMDAMELLPEPDNIFDIRTDYGTVRVYKFSNESDKTGIPVVLLPGRLSGTPMWSRNLNGLLSERAVYIIDILGDAGMSVQTGRINNSRDQALWLEQVFAGLELSGIHLAGHSFGGYNAANYAVYYPDRIVTLDLLEPVFVFSGLKWQFYIKSLPASLPFLPERMRKKMLAEIGGTAEVDLNDPVAGMIAAAAEHYSIALPLPEVLTEEQLNGLSMPVYIAFGGRSIIHDVRKASENAMKNLRNKEIKIWDEGTHSLPMEFPEELNHDLNSFMKLSGY